MEISNLLISNMHDFFNCDLIQFLDGEMHENDFDNDGGLIRAYVSEAITTFKNRPEVKRNEGEIISDELVMELITNLFNLGDGVEEVIIPYNDNISASLYIRGYHFERLPKKISRFVSFFLNTINNDYELDSYIEVLAEAMVVFKLFNIDFDIIHTEILYNGERKAFEELDPDITDELIEEHIYEELSKFASGLLSTAIFNIKEQEKSRLIEIFTRNEDLINIIKDNYKDIFVNSVFTRGKDTLVDMYLNIDRDKIIGRNPIPLSLFKHNENSLHYLLSRLYLDDVKGDSFSDDFKNSLALEVIKENDMEYVVLYS